MNGQSPRYRGWVKGLSMWPNLIPGDILRVEKCQVRNLKPGMIAVFFNTDTKLFIVHRVISFQTLSANTIVQSGGDRSGLDEMKWHLKSSDSILRITGVLRGGRYESVRSLSVPVFLSPSLLVRLHCGIVRKLFW